MGIPKEVIIKAENNGAMAAFESTKDVLSELRNALAEAIIKDFGMEGKHEEAQTLVDAIINCIVKNINQMEATANYNTEKYIEKLRKERIANK